MEWEQSSKNTKTDKEEGEKYLLNLNRNICHRCNLIDIHGCSSTEIVNTKDSDNQQSRTTHQHQCQLHGRILLRTGSPYTYEQIHWYQRHLIEHKHGEQ